MKKVLLILTVAFVLAACETAPPQWWDPSGKYMVPEQTVPAAKPAEPKGVSVRLGGPPAPQQPVDDNAILFEPVERERVEVADLPPPSVLQD